MTKKSFFIFTLIICITVILAFEMAASIFFRSKKSSFPLRLIIFTINYLQYFYRNVQDRQSYDFMQIHLTSIGNLQFFCKTSPHKQK